MCRFEIQLRDCMRRRSWPFLLPTNILHPCANIQISEHPNMQISKRLNIQILGPGLFSHLLTLCTLVLVLATLPFSLFFVVKVVQVEKISRYPQIINKPNSQISSRQVRVDNKIMKYKNLINISKLEEVHICQNCQLYLSK